MLFTKLFIKIANAQSRTASDPTSSGLKFQNPIGNSVSDLPSLIAKLLEFVTRVGAAAVVFMVIYSGFLFVKAQGDPEEIKKAKSTFLWTVVGGVVLLGAATLAALIESTVQGLGAGI